MDTWTHVHADEHTHDKNQVLLAPPSMTCTDLHIFLTWALRAPAAAWKHGCRWSPRLCQFLSLDWRFSVRVMAGSHVLPFTKNAGEQNFSLGKNDIMISCLCQTHHRPRLRTLKYTSTIYSPWKKQTSVCVVERYKFHHFLSRQVRKKSLLPV